MHSFFIAMPARNRPSQEIRRLRHWPSGLCHGLMHLLLTVAASLY